jgi:hypothetical protein
MMICQNTVSISLILLMGELVRILRFLFLDVHFFSVITTLTLGLPLGWHIIVAVAKRKDIFIVVLTRHRLIDGLVVVAVLLIGFVSSKLLSRLVTLKGNLSLL